MELKRNSPIVLAIAVVLIAVAILYLMSLKAQVQVNYTPTNLSSSNQTITQEQGLFPPAPELQGIAGYINAPENFTLASQKGKVILVDFWTYSCINCIRTLPYLEAWNEKYANEGLVIVGVHSPEFEFEKNYTNVQTAVQKFGITYPVVLDNDHATWSAYQNLYWPHDYLIDANGFIRYDHIGEGDYNTTEQEIQQLLSERNTSIQMGNLVAGNVSAPQVDYTQLGTPEIYLGYQFARSPIGNPEGFQNDQIVNYTLPSSTQPNLVYFEGSWQNNPDNMELASDTGTIVLNFQAKNVNIVAGGNSTLDLLLNGSPATSSLGFDAAPANGAAVVNVSGQRLYSLINKNDYSPQTITIHVQGKGFRIYTFTFG